MFASLQKILSLNISAEICGLIFSFISKFCYYKKSLKKIQTEFWLQLEKLVLILFNYKQVNYINTQILNAKN